MFCLRKLNKIILKRGVVEFEFNNTKTAAEIKKILPIKGIVSRWGDEIYFEIPLKIKEKENAKQIMEIGDIAYWRQGTCFCIFFGKTPLSKDDKPVAADLVNVFGKVKGNLDIFKKSEDGEEIRIE